MNYFIMCEFSEGERLLLKATARTQGHDSIQSLLSNFALSTPLAALLLVLFCFIPVFLSSLHLAVCFSY